jgi:hypothetical protein
MSDSSLQIFASCPVTHILPRDLTSGRAILCCGEVEADLHAAFAGRCGPVLASGRYRTYAFWRYADFTLVLAGIGTGSVEPLLWEILTPGVLRQAVLIGTAGTSHGDIPLPGRALPIAKAWACGSGLDGELGLEPALPRWNLPEGSPTNTIASSDFFYGYSDRVLDASFRACQGPFRTKYRAIRDQADLIDMEVAPFYYFAPRFDPTGKLEYIAVKGSSNALGKGEEMNDFASSVLSDCAQKALELLGL